LYVYFREIVNALVKLITNKEFKDSDKENSWVLLVPSIYVIQTGSLDDFKEQTNVGVLKAFNQLERYEFCH